MLLQKSKNCLKWVTENDFNISTVEAVKPQIVIALESSPKKEVALVFGEADVIDDTGLKLLIGLYQECLKKDLKLSLTVKSSSILETVHLCKLDQLIDVKES